MNSGQQSDRSLASVADYYDRAADSWDRTHGAARQNPRFARQIRDSLRALLSAADRSATALELGAGTGPRVDTTAPLFARLIAIDVSDGMLAVFARRIAQLGLTNVTLLRQDACDLRKIATESVDVVYSVGLLETVVDFDRLFAESYRVLRQESPPMVTAHGIAYAGSSSVGNVTDARGDLLPPQASRQTYAVRTSPRPK
jgi:ubiquinone/menaquinone biosynthesis C-methylase UbiE